MNKKLYLLLFVFALAHTNIVFSQSKDEQDVNHAVESLRAAMVNADSVQLDALTSDKLSYGHSGGKIEDKKSFIHSLTSGQSDFVTITLTDQQVTMFDHVAIVRHTLSADTNDGGKPGTVKLSVLTVWQKEKKDWKLIARQAVKFPQQ